VLLYGLFHALVEKRFEFAAHLFRLSLEFVQEFPLLIVDFAVGKEGLPKPACLPSADSTVSQYVILDGPVEELLKSPVTV
jgi:hypothetical protein